MYYIRIGIAGVNIEIHSEYRISSATYSNFRTNSPTDYVVYLKDEDIDFTPVHINSNAKLRIKTSAILEKITDAMLCFNTILMHGVVIAKDHYAFLFTAPSHTGKTTHAQLWLDRLPDAFVVNGDKPFIKFPEDGSQPLACGSPWAGKENLYTNTMVPLKSIILMERAEENHIEQISFAEAFPFLLQQVYRPEDEDKMRKTLRLMQRLNGSVSFWRFHCNNFKPDCFDVAYNALVKGQPSA